MNEWITYRKPPLGISVNFKLSSGRIIVGQRKMIEEYRTDAEGVAGDRIIGWQPLNNDIPLKPKLTVIK